jgi:hypothetical protein
VSSAAEAYPNHLDLSVAHRHKRYDKLGNRLLLQNFKNYYFGCWSGKFTKPQCEEFFDNAANFFKAKNSERPVTKINKFYPKKGTWNDGLFEDGAISEEKHHAIN